MSKTIPPFDASSGHHVDPPRPARAATARPTVRAPDPSPDLLTIAMVADRLAVSHAARPAADRPRRAAGAPHRQPSFGSARTTSPAISPAPGAADTSGPLVSRAVNHLAIPSEYSVMRFVAKQSCYGFTIGSSCHTWSHWRPRMSRTNAGPSAFLDPAAPTLATVIDRLATAEPDPQRRGEMVSAVRTLCRVLGRLPHELPADTALLNRLHAQGPAGGGRRDAGTLGQCPQPGAAGDAAHRLPDHAGPPAAPAGPGLGGARRAPARSLCPDDRCRG